MIIRVEFANLTLTRAVGVARLGALRAFCAWFHAESAELPNTGVSGKGAKWNPAATSMPMPGATRYNDVGVRNYLSFTQGVDATVKTLKQTDPFDYSMVIDAISRVNVQAEEVLWAIHESPWNGSPGYIDLLLERLQLYNDQPGKLAGLQVGP